MTAVPSGSWLTAAASLSWSSGRTVCSMSELIAPAQSEESKRGGWFANRRRGDSGTHGASTTADGTRPTAEVWFRAVPR